MVYDRERERRDDAAYAEHKEAVARGEKRVLRRTRTGELHSYPADEIGFTPGRGQAQVSTWWGMAILAAFGAVVSIAMVALLIVPVLQGSGPSWGLLWPLGIAGFLTWYGFKLSRDEYRATQLRVKRGSPKPGNGSVDLNLLELGSRR